MIDPIINISMIDGSNLGSGGTTYASTFSGGEFSNNKFILNGMGYLSVPVPFMNGDGKWTIAFQIDDYQPSTNTYSRFARGNLDVPSIFWTNSQSNSQAKLAYGSANTSNVSIMNNLQAYVVSNGAIMLRVPQPALFVFRNDGNYITLWMNGQKLLQEASSRYTSEKWASTFSIGDDAGSSYYMDHLECSMLKLWDTSLTDENILSLSGITPRKIKYKEIVDMYPTNGALNYSVNDLTVNYVFPVVPYSTYKIKLTEIGNRLRSIFLKVNPLTVSSSISSGITDIVMNPTFDVGYEFTYTPSEYGYILVYVSNEGGYPEIDISSDGIGGDSIYEFQTECVENTSSTSQSASITAINRGIVLATVTARSVMTYPSGWKILRESTALSETNLNQRMAFLSKVVKEGETVTFTATQASSGRIYINLIVIGDAGGLSCSDETEYITETQINSHATNKLTDSQVIWGCTANLWDTGNPHQQWSCNEINTTIIALPTSTQGRQSNFIDVNIAGERTFISGSANTGAIIDYVTILPPYDKKYLIRSETTLYTVVDGALSILEGAEISSTIFQTYGIEELPDNLLLIDLINPEILYWHDSMDDLPKLKIAVTGVPPVPQTVITSTQDMSDATILGIEGVQATCSDDILFAISFDDEATWKAYDGTSWITLDLPNTGMTKATMENIDLEAWAEIVTSDFYKFRFILPTTDSYLTSLVVNYIN